MDKILLLPLLLIHYIHVVAGKECDGDADCQTFWPQAVCARGRCRCGKDFLRRKSASFGWVCLSLNDAVTGSLGAQETCPFPAGAGHLVALKDENKNIVMCDENNGTSCGDKYECIGGISAGGGTCCPRKEASCDPSLVRTDDGGWLERWYFDGTTCSAFDWNPETTQSPNTFASKQQCDAVCGHV
ncbi:unnamed protein product [Bursaphelenchus okinawaensis]|uniref:BPTI/Kunitz inhibitor domain-containing protein n=1 Tax=Bursaphelenchus okinawaensis TaxID=465554 RepID=A0A811LJ85_9BILA|nr:unnamed protein product [Bursaphelenchus okinawaensis]CAG9127145.1 unnamed protein product [Bursaphelenchus okinawaensis]